MRLRRAQTLSLAAVAGILLSSPALAARFVDTSNNWTEHYINNLSDKGVIPAESDGKFHPNEPVTRAQLAAWLVKVLNLEDQPVPSASSFADVKTSDWFFKPVEIIRQNNIIAGYADGFRPHQFIQRAEVLTIIARTLNVPDPDESTISKELGRYSDGAKVPSWAKSGVTEASLAGIVVNEAKPEELQPTDIAKRGETAAFLGKLQEFMLHQKEQAAANSPQAPSTTVTPPAAYAQPPQQQQPAQFQSPPNYSAPAGAGFPPASGPYGAPPQGYAQPPYGYGQPPYAGQVSAQGSYQQPPYNAGAGQIAPYGGGGYGAPPLQGSVAAIGAGTKFQANLKNTLDSGSTQPGEEVQATVDQPIYANGQEVVPSGSRLIGNVSNVVSAKRFKAGANGKIDIRFTSIETPDGRRFPLSASVDGTQIHLTGGSTAGRVGKGVMTTAIGAGSGAALGTALGAIVGATSGGGHVGKATGMGAVFGTALGGGVGAVGAVVRKGSEVKITAGTSLPVKLDQSLQLSPPAAQYPPPQQYPPQQYPPPQQYGAYPTGYAPPPVQQPATYYAPQQQ
jgi:hypothetical protein